MKARTIVAILIIIVFTGALAFAVQHQGAKDIKLDGGKKGVVDFPHHLHQSAIGDCNACHAIFPKTEGIIKALKMQGKLKKKQVMNKTCIKCHKEKKKAGVKTGPTKCSACHVK
ncbi:MAG: cytochrome c3 family protein [Desulfobacterales bacterium]|nr:cytochrome c3 family protein [Desulfobacterales bacterium]MDX2509911.1 cytochrome c3 family protein [Desulfobacterales bacterium]